MRRHVLALLLLLVAVAPCGRAATGHEVSSIEYGPSLSGSQTLIASNGSNFVAIWTSTTFPPRVLGSILDRDGQLVTPHPKLPRHSDGQVRRRRRVMIGTA